MEKYQETQRFITSKWILLFLVIIAVASISGIAQLYTAGVDQINFIAPMVSLLVLVLFAFLGIETQINEHGVYVRFGFFRQRLTAYQWTDMESARLTKYSPLKEYGGWGYRRGFLTPNKRAYSVIGNYGLELKFKDGSVVMIGTQNPDYLKAYLQVLKSKYKIQAIIEAN